MLARQIQDRGKISEDVRSGTCKRSIWLSEYTVYVCLLLRVSRLTFADSDSDHEHEDWLIILVERR